MSSNAVWLADYENAAEPLVTPRIALKATHDVKEHWSRMLVDEFGPGGWIAECAPEFGREHLLWSLTLLRHVNGRTGLSEIGNAAVAEKLGYTGNNHPGPATVRELVRLGLFTGNGKRGRARKLRLCAPLVLLDQDRYGLLAESTIGSPLTALELA